MVRRRYVGAALVCVLLCGCRSSIGVREAPVKNFFLSLPQPSPASVQTPLTVAVVAADRRPEYSPGILQGALFVPILPYFYGDWEGVPLENCLTFPGKWGTGTEVAANYVHLLSYLTADSLRGSGLVVHAAYPSNEQVRRQYELILRLDFEDFSYGEGLFTYCFPPVTLVPFLFWGLGLPRGYVGAGGSFTWQLSEQCTGRVLGSGRIEDSESTLLGFYYGGGSYPAAIAGIHRQLLVRVVEKLTGEVSRLLEAKDASYFKDLLARHRAWRRKTL